MSKGRKPNKILVDQGGEFRNNVFKRFLKIKNIEMYSRYNKGKSDVAERFIRTLENKIFKHMTAVSKNVYFDALDDIVNKYENTVHRTTKMKPINVTSDYSAEYNEDSNETKPRFKVGDRVRISKYKNIFAKGYTQNWSEEVFVVTKIKSTVPWAFVISDLNGEPITGGFYEKELQKTDQQEFRIEKVIKRKGNKLYVKWKRYDSSFNSWINKKRPCIKMIQYFSTLFIIFGGNVNVKVDLSNYATKTDLKNIIHVDTSSFALKRNLASLKRKLIN